MRKTLLFILSLIALAACSHKPTPQQLAEECMRKHAYHPDELKVLSCNAVLRPERTKLDTFYHIAHVNGIKDARMYAWHDVKSVSYDSVRVEIRHFPEHYYCCATIECVNDCGEKVQGIGEVAVFSDGSAIMFRNYQDRYYGSIADTTWAEIGTLTDVRDRIDLPNDNNGWGLRQMIMQFHAPVEL